MNIRAPELPKGPIKKLGDLSIGDTFTIISGSLRVHMRSEYHRATGEACKCEATTLSGPDKGVSKLYHDNTPVYPVDIFDSHWEFKKP